MTRARACTFAISALALYACAATLAVVAKRVLFPYDFAVWPDEYVLNALVKLRLGAALYTSFDAVNSFIYAPGGVLLHHALLAPFGLDLDIVANRVLSQGWLLLAIVLGVRLVGQISEGAFGGRVESMMAALGAGAALALAGYSNSIADTIHPATLELLVLTIAASVAAHWPRFSPRARIALALVTPACCMLAKQTGVSAAFALAAVAIATEVGSRRHRLTCAAACLASPALAFGALQLASHGAFARWGLLLPLSQPRLWGNMLYVAASLTAIAPSLALVGVRGARAFELRDTEPHAAWLRVATIPVAYAPFAMLAFLKMGGGAFDFGALSFFAALLALSQARAALTSRESSVGPLLVSALAAAQFVLWPWPRHAPTEADAAWGARVCAHVAEAMGCSERVMMVQGVTCLARGGITSVPLDRGFTMMELAWAGLSSLSGTGRRLAAEEYDLLVIPAMPLPGYWSNEALVAMNEHYTIYQSIYGAVFPPPSDIDFGDRARLEGWGDPVMLLFERKRDAGRHRLEIVGPPRCKHTPR